jgi:hypothetical protein
MKSPEEKRIIEQKRLTLIGDLETSLDVLKDELSKKPRVEDKVERYMSISARLYGQLAKNTDYHPVPKETTEKFFSLYRKSFEY